MYAAQCYQACLDGVYAMIAYEDELKKILNENIKGEKRIMNIILKLYDIHEEYSTLTE